MPKNSSKVIAAQPSPAECGESSYTRKISNGYVTTKSCWGPNGYDSSETFSDKPPVLNEKKPDIKGGIRRALEG